jgi:hypothetical protein
MGEYVRCLTLAEGLVSLSSSVTPHFLLSREAPYSAYCPFEHTLLPRSPTLSGEHVISAMREIQPHVVVFDNAGRSAHILEASRSGAAVIYISSRRRQRKKAFRLRWMTWLDEHWIMHPQLPETDLGVIEQLKVRVHPSPPQVRFCDVVLPTEDRSALDEFRSQFAAAARAQVLVVPGGGTAHQGAMNAPEIYAEAAKQIAAAGHSVLHVGSASIQPTPQLCALRHVSPPILRTLMQEAEIVVTNGGDTLLQALALGKACVAAPIAHDQHERLAMFAGGIRSVNLDAKRLATEACTLLRDSAARQALQGAAAKFAVRDQRESACMTLLTLLNHRNGLRDLTPSSVPSALSLG